MSVTSVNLSLPDKNITSINDITSFSYVSDCTALGNPFSVEIRDPTSFWSARIRRGDKVVLEMANANVNSGRPTRKLIGRIRSIDQQNRNNTGRVLRVTGCDLGYHLLKDYGPLGLAVNNTTFEHLLKSVLHPSWGFSGVRWGDANNTNRAIKLGRKQKQLQVNATGKVPLQYIGIEPGETLSSLLQDVAKFDGKLLNVSADGYLQAWNPNYKREPAYRFVNYADDRRSANNMKEITISSSDDGVYSRYTCCGEVLILLNQTRDPNDPHPGRKTGKSEIVLNGGNELRIQRAQKRAFSQAERNILPFFTQKNYADTEQMDAKHAQMHAEWTAANGLFKSWSYNWESPFHEQNGVWFESDQIVSITDQVNHDDTFDPPKPVSGNYWVYRVELHWDKDSGGGTKFKAGKTGLLTAPLVGVGGLTKYDLDLLRKKQQETE